MAVLTRGALEDSPLADLHLIAGELGIDGFRRLRKAALVDAILDRQGGDGAAAEDVEEPTTTEAAESEPADGEEAEDGEPKPRARRSRGGRGRRRRGTEEEGATDEDAGSDEPEEDRPAPRSRRSEDRVVEGTVEVLGNGSGFVRVAPDGGESDDDVYVSAAQVRRCELVTGDRVGGPVRAPRRSERYPSLIRVDTINGKPADEVAEGTPFDELPAQHPTERFAFASEDPTLVAIEQLTPFGRGSRVVLAGPPHSGKTEALRRIAAALATQDGLEVSLVLAGVRPEECSHWAVEPAAKLPLGSGSDARSQAIEHAVDTGRRIAARGGHAVVLIDTLDGIDPRTARKALAAARSIADGGSLTIVATVDKPLGGETTIVRFDAGRARDGRLPAIDVERSGTIRADLLVGEAGMEALAAARAAQRGT